jgi:hypothetical protein
LGFNFFAQAGCRDAGNQQRKDQNCFNFHKKSLF